MSKNESEEKFEKALRLLSEVDSDAIGEEVAEAIPDLLDDDGRSTLCIINNVLVFRAT